MTESFVYCTDCKHRVDDASKVCPRCHSAKAMVDWPAPKADCLKLDAKKQDCLTANNPNPCGPCVEFGKWDVARLEE